MMKASRAKIVAFNVAAGFNAMEEARAVNVEIGYYSVVYELLEELEEKVPTLSQLSTIYLVIYQSI